MALRNCTAMSPSSAKVWALTSDGSCESVPDWNKLMTKGNPVPDVMCDQPCPIDIAAEIGSVSEWDAEMIQQCGGQTDPVSGVVTEYVTVFRCATARKNYRNFVHCRCYSPRSGSKYRGPWTSWRCRTNMGTSYISWRE